MRFDKKKYTIRYVLDRLINVKLDRLIRRIIVVFSRHKPLENTIVIESHNDFDCNGGAFYSYLIKNHFNDHYNILWLVKNKSSFRRSVPQNVEIYPLRKISLKRDLRLARAKYLIADNEVTRKLRSDQVSIFFDHGPFGLKNVKPFYQLIPKCIDYYLSSSINYDPIYCNQLAIEYPNNKMIHCGYPMHDVFFRDTGNELERITDQVYDKVILWMPTFRKGVRPGRNDSTIDYPFEIPLIVTMEDMLSVSKMMKDINSLLVIKLHPMQKIDADSPIFSMNLPNIAVLTGQDVKLKGIDNYRLLKSVDALISDYSSVAYSFILLDKPMAFVLSDMDEMKYGMSVDNPEFFLSGNHIYTVQDFLAFITEVHRGEDRHRDRRHSLCKWLYQHVDGNSCERIADFLKL